MIELTPEQKQAVEQGDAVRVVDPTTHNTYVVMRAELFEQMAKLPEAFPADTTWEIAPGILLSMQAFWRDLPELLKVKRNHRKWVAYHGAERVGIAADDVTLIRELIRRQIPDDSYYLGTIRPRDLPPWEPEEVEDLGSQHLEDY